jgi:hypothetical protein
MLADRKGSLTRALLILFALLFVFGQEKSNCLFAAEHQKTRATDADQHGNADYMTPEEKELVAEINLMRSDPPGYAQLRLVPLRKFYHGKMLFHPDRNPIPVETCEGVAALNECIIVLENTKPLPTLKPSEGLTLSAREMVQDQGSTKGTGHTGKEGSTMSDRIERYGEWKGVIAENISYGFKEPRNIVVMLLIDDGFASRGHRETLLDDTLFVVGVSIGRHRRFHDMSVMDFAGEYTTKKP